MEKTFRLSDKELRVLEYAVNRSINHIETLIEEKKFLEPHNSSVIDSLEDTLLDLECLHMYLFEGGD